MSNEFSADVQSIKYQAIFTGAVNLKQYNIFQKVLIHPACLDLPKNCVQPAPTISIFTDPVSK